jgi:small subunit ribosomal protein S5
MVVVGNGMGGIGVGMMKHPDAEAAVKKALAKATRDMVHINSHKGALYHDLIGKKNNVYVIVRTLPSSVEVFKAAPLVSDILELAGINRYSAKIVGSHKGRRNPYIVTQAVFDAFNHHYPPEREAYIRGIRPVWATADRVTRHTVYPQNPRGPRFPPANSRIQDTGRARA